LGIPVRTVRVSSLSQKTKQRTYLEQRRQTYF
jgi:hypothetical protein